MTGKVAPRKSKTSVSPIMGGSTLPIPPAAESVHPTLPIPPAVSLPLWKRLQQDFPSTSGSYAPSPYGDDIALINGVPYSLIGGAYVKFTPATSPEENYFKQGAMRQEDNPLDGFRPVQEQEQATVAKLLADTATQREGLFLAVVDGQGKVYGYVAQATPDIRGGIVNRSSKGNIGVEFKFNDNAVIDIGNVEVKLQGYARNSPYLSIKGIK